MAVLSGVTAEPRQVPKLQDRKMTNQIIAALWKMQDLESVGLNRKAGGPSFVMFCTFSRPEPSSEEKKTIIRSENHHNCSHFIINIITIQVETVEV